MPGLGPGGRRFESFHPDKRGGKIASPLSCERIQGLLLILNFQFSARPEGTLLQSEATKRILNYFIKRLGGNKKGVPLQSGKQNGLNQSFPIIELCA